MIDLYELYIKEREGKELVKSELGFATFTVLGEECFLGDIFVRPEYRMGGEGTRLMNQVEEIGRSRGCKFLTATIYPMFPSSTESLKAGLAYGLRLVSSNSERIVIAKEI